MTNKPEMKYYLPTSGYKIKDIFKMIRMFKNLKSLSHIIRSYREHVIYNVDNGGLEFWEWYNTLKKE